PRPSGPRSAAPLTCSHPPPSPGSRTPCTTSHCNGRPSWPRSSPVSPRRCPAVGDLVSLRVMGIRGSFSEEAALEYARDNNLGEVEIVELLNTEKVLRAVEGGEIDIGIFALENSNGGGVYQRVHALAPPRPPGRDSIERIAPHQQAIRQCRMWLRHHFPTTLVTEEPDTAEAARM